MNSLDAPTALLVRLAALVAIAPESQLREPFAAAAEIIPHVWIDELLVQSYLFCGLPRALNAIREWRRVSAAAVLTADDENEPLTSHAWRDRGTRTCALVYGERYEKLRINIRALHPALHEAMLVEGYGKILSRPGLDLWRRELCIVAVCIATEQDRQLHSHLHGALNVGISATALGETIEALAPLVSLSALQTARLLLARVVGK